MRVSTVIKHFISIYLTVSDHENILFSSLLYILQLEAIDNFLNVIMLYLFVNKLFQLFIFWRFHIFCRLIMIHSKNSRTQWD